MEPTFRLDLSGSEIDEARIAELTRALKQRLNSSTVSGAESLSVREITRPVASGERDFGATAIAGALGLFAGHVGSDLQDELRSHIITIVRAWLDQLTDKVVIRIKGAGEPITLTTPSLDSSSKWRDGSGDKKYALLIANQHFEKDSGIKDLRFPFNDVDRMRAALLKFSDEYDENSICVLKDKKNYEIEQKLFDLLEKAKKSQLMIYYSGHGKPHPIKNELILASQNTRSDQLSVTGLPYNRVVELINEQGTRKIGIILDCCYSGMAIEGAKGALRDHINAATQMSGKSLSVITASLSTQTAIEKEKAGLGVLTSAILSGIETGEADYSKSGRVSYHDLFQYIKDKIGYDTHQSPGYSARGNDELILVRATHPALKAPKSFEDEIVEVRVGPES